MSKNKSEDKFQIYLISENISKTLSHLSNASLAAWWTILKNELQINNIWPFHAEKNGSNNNTTNCWVIWKERMSISWKPSDRWTLLYLIKDAIMCWVSAGEPQLPFYLIPNMQMLCRVFALWTLIYTELVFPPEITMTTQGVIVHCLIQGRKSADMWRSAVKHVGSIGSMATVSINQMLILIIPLKQICLFDKEDRDETVPPSLSLL